MLQGRVYEHGARERRFFFLRLANWRLAGSPLRFWHIGKSEDCNPEPGEDKKPQRSRDGHFCLAPVLENRLELHYHSELNLSVAVLSNCARSKPRAIGNAQELGWVVGAE